MQSGSHFFKSAFYRWIKSERHVPIKKQYIVLKSSTSIPILVFFAMLLPACCLGSIQIDSVKTTISNCPNNGSITVFITSSNASIFYSIISGPVTQPVQTGNFFNSLPAGTYTVKVSNGANETVTQQVNVTGNYIELDLSPITKDPFCPGGNDGQIIGNINTSTGNGPYTWELVAPSPVTRPSQASDTFNNLIAGNYSVRVTDACGSFRTIVASLNNAVPSSYSFAYSTINIIGCDSAIAALTIQSDIFRFPLTLTYNTNSGVVTQIVQTAFVGNGVIQVNQLLPGLSYGQPFRITLTDSCGTTINTPLWYVQPFIFCSSLIPISKNCTYTHQIAFDINDYTCYFPGEQYTGAKAPLTYVVTDPLTNAVVDSDTLHGYIDGNGYDYITGVVVDTLPTNKNYNITIKDNCGNIFTQTFFLPDPIILPPAIESKYINPDACTDSAAKGSVSVIHFKQEPVLVLLSGPSAMGSTKPGYEYQNGYVYPDTIPVSGFGAIHHIFDMIGLSVGTYQFKIIDSCGTELFDSLVVTPPDVSDFKHIFSYKKGCLGQNEIHYFINNPFGVMEIKNISTGVIWPKYYWPSYYPTLTNTIEDSLLNMPSGTYQITFTYEKFFKQVEVNASPLPCQVITDTIIIEGYQTPTIATSNSILCNNTINIQLIPDSNKGVAPYQYEIIAGPQTFPVQSSNVFTVNTAGTYTARIYDICGNASTASVTADTITFPPLIPQQESCNSIQLFYNAAEYFTYTWTGPKNQVYAGDTLIINPITPIDTGTYQIERIVNINGCTDTAYSAYHLTFPLTYRQVKTVCRGDSVHIGNSTYGATGIFADTLLSSKGCDSIVVLDLTVQQFKRDSVTSIICPGQSITSGGNVYNQTGIYRDTLATATCDSIIILNLRVDPIKKDSTTKIICVGQNVTSGNHTYNQTGIYRDTLATATCDSIIILNLQVAPQKKDSISKVICFGQSVTSGSHTYNQTGIYRDTLATTACDSIVILNLQVDPLKKDSTAKIICFGQSVTSGGNIYNQPGIYRDTIATATCDSIVILNLSVESFKKDSITKIICAGESVINGSHTYNQTGIYRDTITTTTCDSIAILNLQVDPLKKDSTAKIICEGESATSGGNIYNQTGIYTDIVATATCDSIVILNLTVSPAPIINITANPLTVDSGAVVQLNTTPASSYLWSSVAALNSNTIQNPEAIITQSSWIYLLATATPGNCTALDSVFIVMRINPCNGSNSYIYMPNAFTPNNDRYNNVFKIYSNNITLNRFQIFNRWGEVVFETKDINKGWDGTYKGKILAGNYVYFVSYNQCNLKVPKTIKGNIVLIR